MSGRYLLADYKTEEDEKPRVASRTDDLQKAKRAFENSSQRKIKSAVLFDTEKNEFLLIAIEGEPIYLVNVIEFAKGFVKTENQINFVDEKDAKAAAAVLIGNIVKAKAGEAIPEVGGAVLGHDLGPQKGDGSTGSKVVGGFIGGAWGAAVGSVVGGPFIAIVGGVVGGYWGTSFVKSVINHNSIYCINCPGGIGLVDDFQRCPECQGYGYHKK